MSDNILQLNEAAIKGELKDLVKSSVEETLNALLEHEADELVNAERYERSGDRKGYRSGHYARNFTTTSGDVTLHVPKLKGVQFETAIIERYRRRETSIEEASEFRSCLAPDMYKFNCRDGTILGTGNGDSLPGLWRFAKSR